jgi:esterase
MNVRRVGDGDDGLVLRLDLPAIRSMLEDYFATDLWAALERSTVKPLVVVGGRSPIFSPEDRDRLWRLATATGADVQVLENAGHWLHVDDLEGLVEALVRYLGSGPV